MKINAVRFTFLRRVLLAFVCFLILFLCCSRNCFTASQPSEQRISGDPFLQNAVSENQFRKFYADALDTTDAHPLLRVMVLGDEQPCRNFCDRLNTSLHDILGGEGNGFFALHTGINRLPDETIELGETWTVKQTEHGFFSHHLSFSGRQRSVHFTDDPEGWFTSSTCTPYAAPRQFRLFLRNRDESGVLYRTAATGAVEEINLSVGSTVQVYGTTNIDFFSGETTLTAAQPPELVGVAFEGRVGVSCGIFQLPKLVQTAEDRFREKIELEQLDAGLFVVPIDVHQTFVQQDREKVLPRLLHLRQRIADKPMLAILIVNNQQDIKSIQFVRRALQQKGIATWTCTPNQFASGRAAMDLTQALRKDHWNKYRRYLVGE